MKFESLGLTRPILDALYQAGYKTPTSIQEQAIPAALAGRDVLGCARTGTGKTCAFAAPILQRLTASPQDGRPTRALVLAPTRELAIQDRESFVDYGVNLDLKSTVIFGGVGQDPQVKALRAGCDILVATPGRLEDLHQQGFVDVSQLEILVLDEADRMLDMGFIHDVQKILNWLPKEKQTLFFSATMPEEISKLADSLLHNPVKIAVDPVSSPVEAIDQSVCLVDSGNKTKLLIHLLEEHHFSSALVFTRTKHGANLVTRDLTRAKISAAAIHGNKSQSARQEALAGFKSGSIRVLVATDIAARGLDIQDLDCVFNYNLPEVPETYIHRIGRTGRAGKDGMAISFCDCTERPLLRNIEKLLGHRVPVTEGHPYPMEIFEIPEKNTDRTKSQNTKAKAKPAAQIPAGPVKTKSGEQTASKPAVSVPVKTKPKASVQTKAKPTDREDDLAAVHLPEARKYKRPERKPISALDEIAPALSENEIPAPLYGEKRTGHLRNTFFTPEEQAAYGGKPEPLMDATARLLSTKKSVPERYRENDKSTGTKGTGKSAVQKQNKNVGGQKRNEKTDRISGSKFAVKAEKIRGQESDTKVEKTVIQKGKTVSENPKPQTKQSQKSQNKKKRKSGTSKPKPAAETQGTPAASQRLLTNPPKKGKHRNYDRPMPDQRSIYGVHKRDSTEQSASLIKPYYLSDDK